MKKRMKRTYRIFNKEGNMMKKDEFIAKYGEEAYQMGVEQKRAWQKAHREEHNAQSREWWIKNPEKGEESHHEINRKGGKLYEWKMKYQQTGISGERHSIRVKHGKQWRRFKKIIAPDSQIHHEWIPQTAEYRGVALVEANPHQYGIIDVIQILDGKITLLTEEEVKRGDEYGT